MATEVNKGKNTTFKNIPKEVFERIKSKIKSTNVRQFNAKSFFNRYTRSKIQSVVEELNKLSQNRDQKIVFMVDPTNNKRIVVDSANDTYLSVPEGYDFDEETNMLSVKGSKFELLYRDTRPKSFNLVEFRKVNKLTDPELTMQELEALLINSADRIAQLKDAISKAKNPENIKKMEAEINSTLAYQSDLKKAIELHKTVLEAEKKEKENEDEVDYSKKTIPEILRAINSVSSNRSSNIIFYIDPETNKVIYDMGTGINKKVKMPEGLKFNGNSITVINGGKSIGVTRNTTVPKHFDFEAFLKANGLDKKEDSAYIQNCLSELVAVAREQRMEVEKKVQRYGEKNVPQDLKAELEAIDAYIDEHVKSYKAYKKFLKNPEPQEDDVKNGPTQNDGPQPNPTKGGPTGVNYEKEFAPYRVPEHYPQPQYNSNDIVELDNTYGEIKQEEKRIEENIKALFIKKVFFNDPKATAIAEKLIDDNQKYYAEVKEARRVVERLYYQMNQKQASVNISPEDMETYKFNVDPSLSSFYALPKAINGNSVEDAIAVEDRIIVALDNLFDTADDVKRQEIYKLKAYHQANRMKLEAQIKKQPAQQDEPKKAQPRYNVNPEVQKAFELAFLPKFDKYYDLSYIGDVDAIQDLETAEKLFGRVVNESNELTEMLYEPTTTPEEKLEIYKILALRTAPTNYLSVHLNMLLENEIDKKKQAQQDDTLDKKVVIAGAQPIKDEPKAVVKKDAQPASAPAQKRADVSQDGRRLNNGGVQKVDTQKALTMTVNSKYITVGPKNLKIKFTPGLLEKLENGEFSFERTYIDQQGNEINHNFVEDIDPETYDLSVPNYKINQMKKAVIKITDKASGIVLGIDLKEELEKAMAKKRINAESKAQNDTFDPSDLSFDELMHGRAR